MKPRRAEALLNAFVPMHYGTFGGLPSLALPCIAIVARLVVNR
ncbi:MAG: hypothetical protein ACREPR_21990 [Brasilonema sp.]